MNFYDSGILLLNAIEERKIKVFSVHSIHKVNELASKILINTPFGLPEDIEVAIIIQSLETTNDGKAREEEIFSGPKQFKLFIKKFFIEHRLYP
jgi:hypothetical protein